MHLEPKWPLFWEGLTFKNRGRIGVLGISWVWPPPSNTGKWRLFSYGIPKPKDVVILLVTIASGKGPTPNIYTWIFCKISAFLVGFSWWISAQILHTKRKIQVKIVTPQFDLYFWRCNPSEKRMAKDGSGQGTKNQGIRFFTKEDDAIWRTYFSNGLVQSPLLRKKKFIWRNMLLCSHFFFEEKNSVPFFLNLEVLGASWVPKLLAWRIAVYDANICITR